MTPLAQLLLRNREALSRDANVLWINPTADGAWSELIDDCPGLTLWSQDYASHRVLKAAGAPVKFGAFPRPEQYTPSHLILSLPRSKERLAMMLDLAAALLWPDGSLWLAGENRAGIKSAHGALERRFRTVASLDQARRCTLLAASSPLEKLTFEPADYRHTWQWDLCGSALEVSSWPGVFAHGKPDEGTDMLLDTVRPLSLGREVLDFGCGCGIIAASVACMAPDSQLTLADTDALALLSSRQTLQHNKLRGEVLATDGFSDIRTLFDTIITNPPFHRGNQTDTRLGMQLLTPVRNFLNPGGQLLMVANRHIPYRAWLDDVFGSHEVLAASDRFQVLQAIQTDRKIAGTRL